MTAPSRDRLRFGCPRCLTRLEARPTQAGKSRRCPVCYFKLTVPTPEQVAATAAKWREPGYQLLSGQNETIPHAAAYQTYFAVICSVCGTRMYATPSQVGQEIRCPDCDTPVKVMAPAATPPGPGKEANPASAGEEYPLYQGEGQPPRDHQEVYQRYIPVVCPICHTRMLATPEQVGERLICPDCETPSIVPPPEEVVAHEPLPVPSRDPNDVYDIAQPAGPPPLPGATPVQRSYVAAVCPVCHTRLDVTDDKVGTIIECPDCGTRFAVHRPKAAPPKPDPLVEIGEEYGVAPPMEVAQRKPAVSDPGDLTIDSDEHRTAEERRGLEEEWKSFNQQLRSGGGWQPSPTPVVASVSVEPEKEPTESFFSGVFTFPFYRSSIAYWVALSLGLMFVVLPPTFAYLMATRQSSGPEWTWVIVASILAFIAGLIWVLMTSSSCLAILQDTAEGCDDVENWPEGQIFEWLFDAAYILAALILATAAGLTVARVLLWSGHPWWPSALIVGWLMFPFILVSMLEAGSPLLPFSAAIVRSLLVAWWAWFLFYLETTVLFAVVGALGAAVTIYTHYWGCPVAIVLTVAVLMIYFRLVGRLIWFCSHEGVLEDEDKPQRTDDKLLHKRAAEVE